jgi:hypothetical protein
MIMVIGVELWPSVDTLVAGLVSVAAAEWLILGRRSHGSGFEESLEVAGLLMLAHACLLRASPSGDLASACFGAALAVAGARLLNPIFVALSALAFGFALDAPPLGSGLACYGVGLLALAAGGFRFRRPFYDLTLDYLVIAMPVAGYLWSASRGSRFTGLDYRHAGWAEWLVPVCCLVYGASALVTGLRRRTHAPLLACMLCLACCAYELRRITGLSLEARLIAWGCVLLVMSIVLERYLRVPRGGFTSLPILDDGRSLEVLGLAGSAVLTPLSPPSRPAPSFQGGGGSFGGGGASGQY